MTTEPDLAELLAHVPDDEPERHRIAVELPLPMAVASRLMLAIDRAWPGARVAGDETDGRLVFLVTEPAVDTLELVAELADIADVTLASLIAEHLGDLEHDELDQALAGSVAELLAAVLGMTSPKCEHCGHSELMHGFGRCREIGCPCRIHREAK